MASIIRGLLEHCVAIVDIGLHRSMTRASFQEALRMVLFLVAPHRELLKS